MGGTNERAASILDRAQRTTYHEDTDGTVRINTYQDVQGHLDYAAQVRREDSERRGKFGKRKDLSPRMIAPFNVIMGVAKKLGIAGKDVFDIECNRRIWKELESVEYKKLRLTNAKRL